MDPAGRGVSNGYYGDDSGGRGGGDSQQQKPKDDFEDYMWMANEEEVEKEMLKQIEDEQIAQKCFSEMLEEEERLTSRPGGFDQSDMWQTGQMGWSTGCLPPMEQPDQQQQQQQQQPWSTCQPGAQQPADTLARDIGSLSVNDRPKVELNPLAAEFVPGQSFQPASG
ncbi:polyadenylate-binding protein-interacting protein 2B-like [Amphibalanus amphitrite]|uniref:polyadenylate-binding protein-interacting protein 2B-like n=1 Tax=Amphibalanus amphitrite TaxID=1232801 RepID=UPI001C9280AA|nr:polyadenylate-binding protein-interacting protein 2B-like [Amphibalanus amphitrite]XP_043205046.1 polyadenylate-binding protein-interacting protein 2B-like [Amphibalanus amphitrite]